MPDPVEVSSAATGLREVTFEETGERRVVVGRCRGCLRVYRVWGDDRSGVVSPGGTEHIAEDYGMTACGKDATGPGWWWPL